MNRNYLIIAITLFLLSWNTSVFAQIKYINPPDQIDTVQSDQQHVDRLINLVAMIATVFGVVIVVAFVGWNIRQHQVDKEIGTYKEEIRIQRESLIKEAEKVKKEWAKLTEELRKTKAELEKESEKPIDQRSGEKLKELENKIKNIEKEFISSSQFSTPYISGLQSSSSIYPGISSQDAGFFTCKKCGFYYIDAVKSKKVLRYALDLDIDKSICPSCGNVN